MDKQLDACQGKKAVIELVNGRKISGTVLAVDRQCMRVETAAGVGTVPIQAILVVWEDRDHSPNEKNMAELAGQLRDSVKAHIGCTGPQFSCTQQYSCRPPDYCTGLFSCPGSYVPSACGPFEFGSQCNIPGGYICAGQQFYGIVGPPMSGTPPEQGSSHVGCPCYTCAMDYTYLPPDNNTCVMAHACQGGYGLCGPVGGGGCPQFMCGSFQYSMPCICQYAQPCTAQYMQPCTAQYMQPCNNQYGQPCPLFPFKAWNPQCGPLGSYTCREPFSGLTGSAGSESVMSPESAKVSHQPMGFGVQEAKGEDSDNKKE
ncbi:MAG: hypothetical protein PHD36_01315 [Desulfotomaculaceae bacterium]|nr:hypothetical protein [Desulfotomaculaceae bacterium]